MAEVFLSTSHIFSEVTPDIVSSLVCQICLGVVHHPVECGKCQALFCEKEIRMQKKQECPLCRTTNWKKGNDIHRMYRNALQSLTFKCPKQGCLAKNAPLPYDKYIEHQQTCKGQHKLQLDPAKNADRKKIFEEEKRQQAREGNQLKVPMQSPQQREKEAHQPPVPQRRPNNMDGDQRKQVPHPQMPAQNRQPRTKELVPPRVDIKPERKRSEERNQRTNQHREDRTDRQPAHKKGSLDERPRQKDANQGSNRQKQDRQNPRQYESNATQPNSTKTEFYNFFVSRQNGWEPMSTEATLLINFHMASNISKFYLSDSEVIDLQKSQLYNQRTGQVASIKGHSIKEHQKKVRWFVKKESSGYAFLNEATSDQVERYYQAYKTNPGSCIGVNYIEQGWECFADFLRMVQVNLQTNNERPYGRIRL